MPALVHGVIDQNARKSAQEDTEANGQKCQTSLRCAERIWWPRENEWECGEEKKEHAKGEGCV
jgi:hypothetical protein